MRIKYINDIFKIENIRYEDLNQLIKNDKLRVEKKDV
jgi:hypothetical protein